jgi:hypothetical protein
MKIKNYTTLMLALFAISMSTGSLAQKKKLICITIDGAGYDDALTVLEVDKSGAAEGVVYFTYLLDSYSLQDGYDIYGKVFDPIGGQMSLASNTVGEGTRGRTMISINEAITVPANGDPGYGSVYLTYPIPQFNILSQDVPVNDLLAREASGEAQRSPTCLLEKNKAGTYDYQFTFQGKPVIKPLTGAPPKYILGTFVKCTYDNRFVPGCGLPYVTY